ncbi:hypothetical protein BDZ45DRAFT_811204 [Acephala macrosclerotiorum]|nr:hypothetical protein BDZ45DRAFT_811204 [Acephala macrosclerotiorum]
MNQERPKPSVHGPVRSGAQNIGYSNLPELPSQGSLQILIDETLRQEGTSETIALLDPEILVDDSVSGNRARSLADTEHRNFASSVRDGSLINPDVAQDDDSDHGTELVPNSDTVDSSVSEKNKRHLWKKLLPSKRNMEDPKIVYSQKKRYILKEFFIFHFLPVGITFGLLGLYLGHIFWIPPWPGTNVLNALQFAAKLHEGLIVASLSCILFHHIRYRLIFSSGTKQQGLQLGLITSSFEIGSPTFLGSKSFWAVCSKARYFTLKDVGTILLLVYVFILVAIVGPSSAITMLPREDWWQPPYGSNKGTNMRTTFFNSNFAGIYPGNITAKYSPEACDYSNPSAPDTYTCPRAGLSDIIKQLKPGGGEFIGYGSQVYNITVQGQSNETYPRTLNVVMGTDTGVASGANNTAFSVVQSYATTPVDKINGYVEVEKAFVMEGSTDFYSWPIRIKPQAYEVDTGRTFNWKQPLVITECSRQSWFVDRMLGIPDQTHNSTYTFPYSSGLTYDPFVTAQLQSQFLPASINMTGMAFLDSNILEVTPPTQFSSAVIYLNNYTVTLCLISAKWIDSDLYATNTQPNVNLEFAYEKPQPSALLNTSADNISLDVEWLTKLNQGTNPVGNTSYFGNVTTFCADIWGLDAPGDPALGCLSAGISLGITEGLSKIASNFPFCVGVQNSSGLWEGCDPIGASSYFSNTEIDKPLDLANCTIIALNTAQRFYAYGLTDLTTILAFVVLFLHTATVLLHISIIVFSKRWSSEAWSGLGELLVLALRSPEPETLANTGAGVDLGRTWRLRASIKELGRGNRVAVVVEDEGSDGRRAENRQDVIGQVRPDWAYS